MRYMLLLYGAEGGSDPQSPEFQQMLKEYEVFTAEVKERGAFLAGDALQSIRTATTVRVSDGEALVTDGPFAETKEALGGYYILDCKDLDEALELAAKVPAARTGSVEVRPIIEYPS